MKERTAYAVVRAYSHAIERWAETECRAEQLEIYHSRKDAEAMRDIWVKRTANRYHVVKVRVSQ